MKKWHPHIRFLKSLYRDKEEKYLKYDIYLIPTISLYYDSTTFKTGIYRDSATLSLQWLIWSINILFDFDDKSQ